MNPGKKGSFPRGSLAWVNLHCHNAPYDMEDALILPQIMGLRRSKRPNLPCHKIVWEKGTSGHGGCFDGAKPMDTSLIPVPTRQLLAQVPGDDESRLSTWLIRYLKLRMSSRPT